MLRSLLTSRIRLGGFTHAAQRSPIMEERPKEKYVPPKARKAKERGVAQPHEASHPQQLPYPAGPSGITGGSFKKRAKAMKYDKKKLAKQAQQLAQMPPPPQQGELPHHVYHAGPPQAALPPIAYAQLTPQQAQAQHDERYGRQSYRDVRDYDDAPAASGSQPGFAQQQAEQRRQWEAQQQQQQMQWQQQQRQQEDWHAQQQWHMQQQQQQQHMQQQWQPQHPQHQWPQQQQQQAWNYQVPHAYRQPPPVPPQYQSYALPQLEPWAYPGAQAAQLYVPPHRQQQQQQQAEASSEDQSSRLGGWREQHRASWRDMEAQAQSSHAARRSSSPSASRALHTSSTAAAPARARKKGQRASSPLPLPLAPRTSYLAGTLSASSRYPSSSTSTGGAPRPSPLPLLLLDLNGTLVFRGGAGNSANPTRRPYLSAFLAYALGVHAAPMEHEQRRAAWGAWEEERAADEAAGGLAGATPHGADFWTHSPSVDQGEAWKSHALEPAPARGATFRILLWSSAQRRNVDAMARAILAPEQAEHVLRVWARDTLVPHRWMGHKAASTKDLEIVWAALNVHAAERGGGQAQEAEREGARRLMAQYRAEVDLTFASEEGVECCASNEEEQQEGTGPAAARLAALEAQAFIVPPSTSAHEPQGRGYGQHNTLLLDDSPDKARLQPYSHLLLPEFDAGRAALVKRWRRERDEVRAGEEGAGAASSAEAEEAEAEQRSADSHLAAPRHVSPQPAAAAAAEPAPHERELDNVLLQLVGVLAHARWERNVSAWIRAGALGYFGGMPQPGMEGHPSVDELDEGGEEEGAEDEEGELRLDAPPEGRTQAFWAREGRKALKQAGIACSVD